MLHLARNAITDANLESFLYFLRFSFCHLSKNSTARMQTGENCIILITQEKWMMFAAPNRVYWNLSSCSLHTRLGKTLFVSIEWKAKERLCCVCASVRFVYILRVLKYCIDHLIQERRDEPKFGGHFHIIFVGWIAFGFSREHVGNLVAG